MRKPAGTVHWQVSAALPRRHLRCVNSPQQRAQHDGAVVNSVWIVTMYKRILVPLDGTSTSEFGLQEAIALAQPLRARLLLLHVLDDLTYLVEMAAIADTSELHAKLERSAHELLSRARHAAADHDVQAQAVIRRTSGRRIGDVIVEEARTEACDVIVMGTHGRRGVDRLLLGSEAMRVAQTSPVPVLLVRSAQPQV